MNAYRLKLCGIACAGSLMLAACGGGGGYSGGMVVLPIAGTATGTTTATAMSPVAGMSYVPTNLVSDLPAASNPYGSANSDPHLVNAWGVAFNPRGFVWVTNTGTSTSTLYDGTGAPQSLVVSIPAGAAGSALPTGIVFNSHQNFTVTKNGKSGASAFIFAGEAGTLSGWSPGVDMTNAVTVFDDGAAGTRYTGLGLASQGASDFLYAADFGHAKVDVFDTNFKKASMPGSFVDQAMPPGYAPFGVQAIGGLIYVSYAIQDAAARNAVAGAGQGAVDVFDAAGNLVKRLVPVGGVLNAPLGMAMAPGDFGTFSNALLVANVGDGKINAFDPTSGVMMGTLSTSDGNPVAIDGLRGIAFGNGLNNQPTNTLFFAAGPSGGIHGVYGRIDNH
ncbi:TIGR03118 family protein [Variovorax humicola]|uniref:TIGR03118 family protein n=1 Tax=Variovorax humicola TaxID=1769758 RepID=A0ABU8W0V1_9BURK